MIATEDIKKGETLFKIPRKLLLEPTQGSLSRELKEYDHWLRSIGRRYLQVFFLNNDYSNQLIIVWIYIK